MASAISFCLHPTRGDDRGSITIINSDGTGTAESFGDFSSLYGLAWSPKGDEVWFTADPTVTTIARRLMAVTMSGAFRLLAAAPGDLTLHDVSADGTAVIAIDDRERKIFFTDSQDSERELTWLDRAVLGALSPDGKQVLFHEGGKGEDRCAPFPAQDRSVSSSVSKAMRLPSRRSRNGARDHPSNPPRASLIPTGQGSHRA